MKSILSKKEIRNNLETALLSEIEKLQGSESTKQIRKLVKKTTKGLAIKLRARMKKKMRKGQGRLRYENNANGHSIELEKSTTGN